MLRTAKNKLEEISPPQDYKYVNKKRLFKSTTNVKYQWDLRPRSTTPTMPREVTMNFSGPGAEYALRRGGEVPIKSPEMKAHQPIRVLLNNYVQEKLYPSRPIQKKIHQWTPQKNFQPARTTSRGTVFPSILKLIPTKIEPISIGTYDLAKPFVIPSIKANNYTITNEKHF